MLPGTAANACEYYFTSIFIEAEYRENVQPYSVLQLCFCDTYFLEENNAVSFNIYSNMLNWTILLTHWLVHYWAIKIESLTIQTITFNSGE